MKDREIKPTPSSAVIIQELKPQYPDEKEISPPDASLYILTIGAAFYFCYLLFLMLT